MAEKNELAKQDYLAGMKYQEIADKYGVSLNTVKSWQKRHGWSRKEKGAPETEKGFTQNEKSVHPKKGGAPFGNKNAKGHGAPKGNKNAVGNKGGPPLGSKNALKTGEFETIWFDTLTEEEQALFGKINTDPLVQAEQEIIFFTFRERRMMERIKRLMDGLTEKEKRIVSELREEKQAVEMYDEKTAQTKTVMVPVPKMVITSITETHSKAIDEILRIEDGLTRVQQQKARWVALKQSIESEAKGEGGDIAKKHAQRLQEVWANRC
ncbi:phage terminase small subunit [Sporomusa aerivorans]|uniref:phage terminase small subunit n=1 Tax=Sporomusa aerivorans TaxID=204936 RepID=UPI00352A9451